MIPPAGSVIPAKGKTMDIGYNIIARNEDEDAVLIKIQNDIFDTVALVYHLDEDNEGIYFLTDMQGKYPETFEEVPDYDWCRAEDINW